MNYVPTDLGDVVTIVESQFTLYVPDGKDEQWQRSGFLRAAAPKIFAACQNL